MEAARRGVALATIILLLCPSVWAQEVTPREAFQQMGDLREVSGCEGTDSSCQEQVYTFEEVKQLALWVVELEKLRAITAARAELQRNCEQRVVFYQDLEDLNARRRAALGQYISTLEERLRYEVSLPKMWYPEWVEYLRSGYDIGSVIAIVVLSFLVAYK